MSRNPSISIGFSQGKFAQEVNKMATELKSVRKEFEISNTAIQATGDTIGLCQNKLKGFAEEAKILRSATAAMQRGLEDAQSTQAKLAAKVDTAKQAYEKAASAENKSAAEVEKLKKEYDDLASRLTKADNAVAKWNSKIQDAQLAENKLKVAVSQVNKEVDEQNKKHVETIKNTQNVTSASGQLLNVYSLIRGLAVGYAGKTLFESLIGGNSQFEQYTTSFEVLLGSADKAKKQMEDINKFAAKTPFEVADTTKSATALLSYGVAQDKVMEKMQQLGDLSSGNAEKLNTVTMSYGKMVSKQKVDLESLNMMTEAGIPIIKTLGEMYGMTGEQIYDAISKGQVSVASIDEAMRRLTSSGGQFYSMMDKQSQTMQGLWSTLKDNINMFARDVGEESFGYLKGALTEFMDKMDEMEESGELGDIAAEWGRNIASFVEFIVNAAKSLWDMKEALIAAGIAFAGLKVAMAITGVIEAIIGAIKRYNVATEASATVTQALNAALKANPWVLLASVVATVVGGLISYNLINDKLSESNKNLSSETNDLVEANNRLDETTVNKVKSMKQEIDETDNLLARYDELKNSGGDLEGTKEELHTIEKKLVDLYPEAISGIDEENQKYTDQIGYVKELRNQKSNLYNEEVSRLKNEAKYRLPVMEGELGSLQSQRDKAATERDSQYNEIVRKGAFDIYYSNKEQFDAMDKIFNDTKAAGKDGADAFIAATKGKSKEIMDAYAKYRDSAIAINQYNELNNQIIDKDQEINQLKSDIAKYKEASSAIEGTGESEDSGTYTAPPLRPSESDANKAAKEAERAYQEGIQKQFQDLKFAKDMEYITESEYYNRLAGLRDAYYEVGSSEWQQYTLEIKQGEEGLAVKAKEEAEKALQAKKDAFSKRRQLSDNWINDEKYYGRLSEDNEIAGYKRIKAYVEEYYNQGVLSYEEYIEQIKGLDKQIYDAERRKYDDRRQNSDNWITEQKEAGKLTTEEEIAAYERIKAYTEQYYKDGIISYEEYIAKIKELDKNIANTRSNANEKEYSNIFAGADNFIDTEEFYDRALSPEKQIEIYEGLKKVALDYYKNGTKTYEEYVKDLADIDKKIYAVRKKALQDYIKTENDTEKDALDKQKAALEQEEKDIKDSCDERKKKIEDYYDSLDLEDKQTERAEKLAKLLKDEKKYEHAVTTEGKAKLKQIQEEIDSLNKEAVQEQRSIDKKKALDEAESDMEKSEADRQKRVEELNQKYKDLDSSQKTLLENIGTYATTASGVLATVTQQIQTMIAAVNAATGKSATGTSGGTSNGTPGGNTSNITNNFNYQDSGAKVFSGPEDIRDYGKEVYNGFIDAASAKGVRTA